MLTSLLSLFGATTCKEGSFLGLRAWYHYINDAKHFNGCEIKQFNILPPNSDVPLVLLAVVDDLLRIAGIAAVAYTMYGGIKYITSQGNPEDSAKAKDTIINALIGLVTASVAVAFVTFVGNQLTK